MMRKLIRYEGLLCGGSSGAAVAAALQAACSLRADQTCVVILPDSVRNYMTKALSDDWMLDHGFIDHDLIQPKQFQTWWAGKRIAELPLNNTPLTITCDVTCKDAIALLKKEGFDMVPVLDRDTQQLLGVVTEGNMTNRLLSGRASSNTTVMDAGVIYKTFHKFAMNDTLADLAQALDHEPYALIVTEQRCFRGSTTPPRKRRKDSEESSEGVTNGSVGTAAAPAAASASSNGAPQVVTRSVVSGIVTRIDLLDFVSSEQSEHAHDDK
jgi:cystathionine beta-synthase